MSVLELSARGSAVLMSDLVSLVVLAYSAVDVALFFYNIHKQTPP